MLERILVASADEPVSVVATVGDHIEAATIAARPPSVHGRIPHLAIVPGAAVVVCHAGLGTILAALRHGVPVVCIPLGRDQHANAAAVVAAGAGRTLALDVSADDIRAAVGALLVGRSGACRRRPDGCRRGRTRRAPSAISELLGALARA